MSSDKSTMLISSVKMSICLVKEKTYVEELCLSTTRTAIAMSRYKERALRTSLDILGAARLDQFRNGKTQRLSFGDQALIGRGVEVLVA